MKGVFTLAIYVAIGITGTAFGQNKPSPIPQTPAFITPQMDPALNRLATESAKKTEQIATQSFRSSDGWLPPSERLAAYGPAVLEPVVMYEGKGGLLSEHEYRFRMIGRTGAKVEMRGPCYSACTLLLSYIPKERLCFAPGAFLAFHSARSVDSPRPQLQATLNMYASYPAEIRNWIDDHGGPYKMTVETYWTMYDRELWAMGYPRCKPVGG